MREKSGQFEGKILLAHSLMGLVVRLSRCQDRSDGNVTRVRRKEFMAGQVEDAQHRPRRAGSLQLVEAVLSLGDPREQCGRLPSAVNGAVTSAQPSTKRQ